jgi:DNA polymerase I
MSLIRTTVAGDTVKLFVLPPSNDKYLDKFRDFARSDDIFGLDVETTAIDEELGCFDPAMSMRMIQFGSADAAWALDPHDSFWRPWIIKLLRWEIKRFVSHTNYDPLWVGREFDTILGQRIIDTIAMAALLYPGNQPKDLKTLTTMHIDAGLRRAEEALSARFRELAPPGYRVGKKLKEWGFTNIPLDDPIFGQYAGLDAVYVRRLLPILAALVKKAGMAKLSFREQRIARMATGIQRRGLLVDRDYTNSLLGEIEDEYTEADTRLWDTFGFSPRSPKRGKWLAEKGVEFVEFSDKGNPTLDKESIPDLLARYKKTELGPIFEDMVTLSTRQNLLNNLRTLLRAVDANGFVHPKINTQQAITGRMSIVRPAMQTFKKRDPRLRGCFVFRPGYLGVGADYHSQEIRLAAAFSNDELLWRIILEGLNQHDLTAEELFGKDYAPEQRDAAKILDFAQQYGAGPKKIGDQLGMPRGPRTQKNPDGEANPEAVKMWNAWRKAYSGLVAWSSYVSKFSVVENPWGRQIPSDRFRRYANGNYAIQSSGRDVLGDAMVKLEDMGWGEYLWLPIHDELVLEVPEDRATEAVKVLEEAMFAKVGEMPLTAEAKIIGRRWNGAE